MNFLIARLAAFFLLFVSASSAPTGQEPHDACTAVRNSALEFNKKAKEVVTDKSGHIGIKNFSTSLAWMEAQDQCDPGNLRRRPEPCIKKILNVLTSYKSYVTYVANFDGCPVAREVQPVLLQLHKDMSSCVMSRTNYHHHNVDHISEKELQDWQKPLLCRYTMERLFSFSILTARVFSRGDPVNHEEPTKPADFSKCA